MSDAAASALESPRRPPPALLAGGAITAAFILLALISRVWTPQSPTRIHIALRLKPPLAAGLLGTDPFGRDVLSMLMAGTWTSLSTAFLAVALGLLLILLFSTSLNWFSAGGWSGWSAGAGKAFAGLILPAIALALPQAGVLTRVTRAAVLDVLAEDFIRTARAKGLDRHTALWRHALPNALLPVVTILGLQVSFLVAGAVLVENVFSLPGLGRLAYLALSQRDLIVLRNVVMLLAAMVILANFIVDLVYLILDPRLRARS